MQLSTLFQRCLTAPYICIGDHTDYAAERLGNSLYLYFEASQGAADWRNNLDFPARPYKRMGKTLWFAHRGFLRVWRSAEPYIAREIEDPSLQRVIIAGYSHGGALAVFCHEYVGFHRPDLRRRIIGYGFGCPRVLWGLPSPAVRERWKAFTVVRNGQDPVTHLPPAVLGYTHVGNLLRIGDPSPSFSVDAHRPEQILSALYSYEHTQKLNAPRPF